MEFNVCLDQFEGPLDLMLHLVRTSKLDLFELNLDILAGQYVAYIRQALDLALDVSSEYLVEFTSLMEYKSKKLLPRNEDVQEDTYQEDPAKALARRLREYEQCKKEAQALEQLEAVRRKKLEREPASLIETWAKQAPEPVKMDLPVSVLVKAFERVIRRYSILQPYETSVEIRELSVEERMDQIAKLPAVHQNEPFLFERLLEDVFTLREAVVTFLALLELVHSGVLFVRANLDEGEIWIQNSQFLLLDPSLKD